MREFKIGDVVTFDINADFSRCRYGCCLPKIYEDAYGLTSFPIIDKQNLIEGTVYQIPNLSVYLLPKYFIKVVDYTE